MTPVTAAFHVWNVWIVTWVIAAIWSSRAAKRPLFGQGALHWIVTIAGFGIMSNGYEFLPPMGYWPPAAPLAWMFVGLVALGFVFTWWARLYLGTLWSASVTIKPDHKVVDTGPYALVRHPIYTGMIFAAAMTAAAIGSGTAFLGAAIMALGLWIKARLEERFIRQELGAETYDSYRARVPMLVPFLHIG